jgi:hypothetical protein
MGPARRAPFAKIRRDRSGRRARKNAKTVREPRPTKLISPLKPFQIHIALPAMTMNDRVDRRGPVPSRYIVPQECKLQPATAEQPAGFKSGRKSKAAAGDPDPASGTIGTGAPELSLCSLHNLKYVVGVIGYHPERIPRLD